MNRISPTELVLLKICIQKGEASVREVYEETLKSKKRSYTTIKTLLDRMVERGFLRSYKDGNICIYSSKVTESQVVRKAIDEFSKSILGGTILPLFTYFAQSKKMSDEELKKLRKLIDEKEEI